MLGAVATSPGIGSRVDPSAAQIPRPRRRARLRRLKLICAWGGVLTLGSLLAWAITWLQPPKPAALALWGAGYQQNLSVPHNVYGWNTLTDLSKFAQHSSDFQWGGTWLRLEQAPTVIRSDSPWRSWFNQFREPTLVLCVSMHGAADRHGPYLLCADTSETAGVKKFPIEQLVERLGQLPAEKNKLLVIDATQVDSDWRLGILRNEFARGLIDLNEQIAEVPNLVVLCASDINQRSWVCEDRRRTVFGHYLIEALAGAARDSDDDGRINAWELHQSVRTEVSRWTRTNRRATQTPILLPLGDEGPSRARNIDLGAYPRRHIQADPQPVPPFTAPDELRQAWAKYQRLSSDKPWGFACSPSLWREYQAVMIRYEELVRAGDSAAAAVVRERLQNLEFQMLNGRGVDLESSQNTLAMWAACGAVDQDRKSSLDALNQLWNAAAADYADLWRKALTQAGGSSQKAALLRIGFYEALLDRVAEAPAENLSKAAGIVEAIADPLQPRPAEIHFVLMLNRYLPRGALNDDGGQRIRNAIQVRRMAERAAVGLQDGGYAYAEEVAPWIADVVADGDAQRRLGEDLLFAAAADRANADAHFQAARKSYQQALDMARQLQTARHTLSDVQERLPYYSNWLVAALLEDGANPLGFTPNDEQVLKQVETLWHEAHRLESQLDRQNPDEIYTAPAPSYEDPRPRSIVDRTQFVQQQYRQVVAQYQHVEQVLADGKYAGDWRRVRHALIVPPVDWRLRMKMLEAGRRKTRQQLIDEHRRKRNAKPQDSAAANETGREPVTSQTHVTSQTQRDKVMRSAHWRGRLALASLGRRLFVESSRPPWESYEQLQHRLDVFQVEEDWWKSLLEAGAQLEHRWRWMPTEIEALVRRAPTDDDTQALEALRLADHLARRIDGAQAASLETKPAGLYRERRLCGLVLQQAQRTLAGRWYAVDPHAEPYFRQVGLTYVADAQRLAPKSSATQAMRNKILAADGLAIAPLPKRQLTTERRVVVRYVIGPGGKSDHGEVPPEGFPAAWLAGDPKLQLLQPQMGQRIVRRLGAEHRQATVLCTIESPVLNEAERKLPGSLDVEHAALTLQGFFRGQLLDGRLPIDLHLRPETLVFGLPPSDRANVSLVCSPQLQQQLGNGAGAVAFVLDCSGSMGPPQGASGSSPTKYAEAVTALREVLAKLPAGVRVSVWVFGEAVGADRTALDPATTIRRVQPPVAWNPKNKQQLATLMQRIAPGRVTPWNQSPIVRAVLAAKADVADAAGFKTIVVITDGVDNTFQNDPVANPNKQSIPAALTEAFQDSGVALNIIGFKVGNSEEQQARQQFEVVEKLFPPGKFYQVGQSAALASVLSKALRHRLRYWMEPLDAGRAASDKRRLLEVGNSSGGEYWFAEPLQPGTYKLRLNADSRIRDEVILAPGDLLPLGLDRASYGLGVNRLAYTAKRFPNRPGATADGWRATVLNAQLLADDRAQFSLALEKQPGETPSRLQVERPRELWIEAAPLHQTQAPGALDWGTLPGYPMPTWSVLASSWPVDNANNAARPVVRMWWNPEQTTPLSGSLRRTAQHKTLEDLAGAVIEGVNESVSVESVAAEQHYVQVADGSRKLQPCLVVRLKHLPGKVHWARLDGVETAGVEHRFYPGVGAYTGLFWPITPAEANERLRGIGVVSLEVLKRDAQARGCHVEIGDVPAPQPGDSRPAPSLPPR